MLIILIVSLAYYQALAATRNGLFTTDNIPIHLLSLKTSVYSEGPYAEIEYSQQYKNPFNHPIETVYYFPRTENSVFHKFEAILNEKVTGNYP